MNSAFVSRILIVALGLIAWAHTGSAAELRIAVSEPLSGPFATLGQPAVDAFRHAADELIAGHKRHYQGQTRIEIVPYDNQISPKEALVTLQKAIDAGIRVISQGQSSAIASALIDAVARHNERNPDDPVLYLNWAAVTPEFTNEGCSYWHFRFDAHADMKLNALVKHMAADPSLQGIYLLNQNYAFGQSFAESARHMVETQMAKAAIVGDDLIPPFGKVKDFAPYIAKIRAAGANAVMTGNWGLDLNRPLQAAFDARLDVQWLTFYAGAPGTLAQIGGGGVGRIKMVGDWHMNEIRPKTEALANSYRQAYGIDFGFYRIGLMLEMVADAADRANSTRAADIARALEGMRYPSEFGEVVMRADDHQLLTPLFISVLSGDVKYGQDGTKLGFKTITSLSAEEAALPHSCRMQRPG